jgi:hypothetical protein
MGKQAEFTPIYPHVSEMEELSVKNRLVPDCSSKLFLFLNTLNSLFPSFRYTVHFTDKLISNLKSDDLRSNSWT